jgi:DNA modification methylase
VIRGAGLTVENLKGTVLLEEKPKRNSDHPTMKPVALVRRMLENSSEPGDVVLDLFGGSGSTLIACEQSGRSARLMELDPRFADVIVKRWQDLTGRTARLEANGQSFKDVRSARSKEGKPADAA